MSVCLSKGLGAPVGSVLLGGREFIREARRVRKRMGGGMRQAGYLAAACLHALDHHVDRLVLDHRKASRLAAALSALPYVQTVLPVETNIVVFDLADGRRAADVLDLLRDKGVRALPFGPHTIRMVTHLDVDDQAIEQAVNILGEL